MTSFEEQLKQAYDKQVQEFKTSKPNVMVVGGTGVGKSSLINTILGKDVAKSGVGEPVTRGCHKYSGDTLGINIFDTEGYEIIHDSLDNSNFEKNVIGEIKHRQLQDLKEQIHLFWYCVSVAGRIKNYDISNIQKLQSLSTKLAVVITKCDTDQLNENNQGKTATAYREELKEEHNIHCPVFEVMTTPQTNDTLELDKLITWSAEALPEGALRQGFIGAQQHCLALKEKDALSIIQKRAMAAAAVGATPIPGSDAVPILAIQMEMAYQLASLYGVQTMGSAATSLLEAQLLSALGKLVASELTKLIPGVGSLINAGVAGGLTYGLGFGLQKLFYQAQSDFLKTGKKPNWAQLFEMTNLFGFDIKEMINKFKQNEKTS